jgi:predicted DNA-binding protein with PD1-like motif|nr:PPC domain-containing DNA-binding protein [Desulfobulbus rhabdoformis]
MTGERTEADFLSGHGRIHFTEETMRYTTAEPGRIFVLRLEDGDIVHEVIEQFADEHNIEAASLIAVGGADDGSRLVVGPGEDRGLPLEIMKETLHHVHEIAGTGTLFRDAEGTPLVHMHMACGRNTQTITGCIREGVRVWHVMEVVVQELKNCSARRVVEEPLGLKLLQP